MKEKSQITKRELEAASFYYEVFASIDKSKVLGFYVDIDSIEQKVRVVFKVVGADKHKYFSTLKDAVAYYNEI